MGMETSIWSATLAEFREKASGTDPVPAGVSICAVSASFALALLTKVLEINRKRKNFTGEPEQTSRLIEGAQRESIRLTHLADDDALAFTRYMACVRNKQSTDDAMREAIRVPMEAARSAARGVLLCREGAALCSRGLTASDLAIATSLLSGAGQAMLISVEANLELLPTEDPFVNEVSAELPELKNRLAT
jgi:formiminotetrahydrofolate cyclodeaminase